MIYAKKSLLLISLIFIIAGICIYNIDYVYSFIVAFGSYVYVMYASYKSISIKLKDKIEHAKKLEIMQSSEQNKQDGKPKGKKLLRFLDFSKAQLGFELSFSISRIIAFVCMIIGMIILVLCNVFYAIVYIAGVLVASFFTIAWLLIVARD